MPNTAPSRAAPVVVFPLSRWCPPQEPHSPIWVRWRRYDCLVSWFCYPLITKPGNKAAAPLQPAPYAHHRYVLLSQYLFAVEWQGQGNNYCCLSRLALTVIGAWISLNNIHTFLWDVITHPCPNFNGSLVKLPLKLGHGWVITSHIKLWMLLCIHVLISVKPVKGPLVLKLKVLNSLCHSELQPVHSWHQRAWRASPWWINLREVRGQWLQQYHTVCPMKFDDVMTWKCFPYYWLFVREIHWWLVDSPHWWPVDSRHKGPVMQNFWHFPCC